MATIRQRLVRRIGRIHDKLQPQEGWLSLLLIIVAVLIVAQSIIDTEWVALDLKLRTSSVLAILLTMIVAKRDVRAGWAWLLIVSYGLLAIPIRIGEWWPPISIWLDGVEAAQAYARPQFAIFVERLTDWVRRQQVGEISREVLPFALGIALLVWLTAAYLTWATYRQRRPLPALALLGGGLALNSYFGGETESTTIVMFLAVAFAHIALVRWKALEWNWTRNRVDYSDELQNEFAVTVLVLAAVLPALSFWLPPLSFSAIAGRFAQSAAVARIERGLEQAFGGVETGVDQTGDQAGGGGGRGTGVMPRAYLLGGAPDLYETVVMTATVQSDARVLPRRTHWRALSYDVYSGAGWWRSDTQQDLVLANQPLALPEVAATVTVQQQVSWVGDDRRIRYTYGLPLMFDHSVSTLWASDSDLSHVRGAGNIYQVESRVSTASAEMLNQAALDAVPPLIIGVYTQLPDSVPQRVHDLAAEITANATTPYEQARAIEAFVRQYEYSLDVPAPPENQDVADFFLFDQQAGYCDYFATAMAVLARSVGLPARMGIGFNPQSADESGVQTIYEIDGHSWTEIYFAGYGWIEFEPTATFVTSAELMPQADALLDPLDDLSAIPIPDPAPARATVWTYLFWCVLLLGIALFVQAIRPAPSLTQRYAQLYTLAQRLPVQADACQTPYEFEARLSDFVANTGASHWLLARGGWAARRAHAVQLIQSTVRAYVDREYGNSAETDPPVSKQSWRRVRWLLILLRWVK